MKRLQKGFSLLELLITLLITSCIFILFAQVFKVGLRLNRGTDNTGDVFQGGVVISEVMANKLSFTSPSLVTLYPEIDKPVKDECRAIGFPIGGPSPKGADKYPRLSLNDVGLQRVYFDCFFDSSLEDIVNSNPWNYYVLYYVEKQDDAVKLFSADNKNNDSEYISNILYEITYFIGDDDNPKRPSCLRKTPLVNVGENSLNDYYYNRLNDLIQNKTASRLIIKKISSNIKTMQVSMNNYPAININLTIDYGTTGTSDISDRRDRNVSEEAEITFTVMPMN